MRAKASVVVELSLADSDAPGDLSRTQKSLP